LFEVLLSSTFSTTVSRLTQSYHIVGIISILLWEESRLHFGIKSTVVSATSSVMTRRDSVVLMDDTVKTEGEICKA
jgi:hypothetical protein